MSKPSTLYNKIIDRHRVYSLNDRTGAGEKLLLYIDRTVLNEYTSPQAFTGLREAGRPLWRPKANLGVIDHVNSTAVDRPPVHGDKNAQAQIDYFLQNGIDFGFEIFDLFHEKQGIEHVVLPEIGWVLPGLVIAAGDSHTTTYGAFGTVGFGIGTSDIEHMLATQCVPYERLKSMRIVIEGALSVGVTPKDLIMAIIRTLGADGAAGYAVEFAGPAISDCDIDGRMTICNMAVECGARVALIAPDEKVFIHIAGRIRSLSPQLMTEARRSWSELRSDEDAEFDREVVVDAASVAPMVSWGTSPDQATTIDSIVPLREDIETALRGDFDRALHYMGLMPGQRLDNIPIDRAFIGSCTNGRLTDLRDAARILKGRKVAPGVRAMISPGSMSVRQAAEAEGLHLVFIEAGFEWRLSGCSMCLAMNDDILGNGERCASSTNRNFEGRQGSGGRTHLMSPAMVAAAAVTGKLTDVRKLSFQGGV